MNSDTKERLRQQIDTVDGQLIELLIRRIKFSNSIIEAKINGEVVDAGREEEIHRRYRERLATVSTPPKVKRLVEALLATASLYPEPPRCD